jgi:MoaA/NifB/PqqE/SkfB family radical SAM enzyme
MDRLRERGVLFTFSATVTRQNFEVVTSAAFIDFWIERGCFLGWYFIYMPIGREPHLEMMPTPEQRVEMSWRIKRHRRTTGVFLVDFWNDGEHAGGCIAGARKYLHINNRGDVEPCVFCHFATDNIRRTSLAAAMNSPFFRAIKSRQPYHEDLRRPCIMIDNPHVLREVCAETGARGTHPGAESLLDDYADALDAYAEAFGRAVQDHGPVTTFKHHV